jgi:hypothetical protein
MDTNDPTETEVVKKRGFWLSTFLIIMFIINPFIAFIYISYPEVITQTYPNITSGVLYFMAALSIINVILMTGVWTWKKWGVLGFYGVVAIAFCMNLYFGIGIAGSLKGLIGIAILFFTTKTRWHHFS